MDDLRVPKLPVGEPQFDGFLLDLFKKELSEKLRQQAIDAIIPAVDEAIEKVIDELKPTIKTFLNKDYSRDDIYKSLYGDVLIKLMVEKPNYVRSV